MTKQEQQKGQTGAKRAPRHQRQSSPKNVHLTERDLLIILAVYDNRFLTTTHIIKLVGTSGDAAVNKLRNRLRLLYDAGYLDRIKRQHNFVVGGGSHAIIYALGDKGADVLGMKPFNIPRAKVEWRAKNRTAKSHFLDHTLMISNIMVELELACRERRDLCVISEREILANATPEHKKLQYQRSMPVKFEYGGRWEQRNIAPDKYIALKHTPTGSIKYFFLEADRGTEIVGEKKKVNINRSSIWLKMRLYNQVSADTLQNYHFGIKAFQVLFVATGATRAKNMVRVNKKFRGKKGWKRFLFTTEEAIKKENILTLGWWNGRDDELVTLVKPQQQV